MCVCVSVRASLCVLLLFVPFVRSVPNERELVGPTPSQHRPNTERRGEEIDTQQAEFGSWHLVVEFEKKARVWFAVG